MYFDFVRGIYCYVRMHASDATEEGDPFDSFIYFFCSMIGSLLLASFVFLMTDCRLRGILKLLWNNQNREIIGALNKNCAKRL